MKTDTIILASIGIILACMTVEWAEDRRKREDAERELSYHRGFIAGQTATMRVERVEVRG